MNAHQTRVARRRAQRAVGRTVSFRETWPAKTITGTVTGAHQYDPRRLRVKVADPITPTRLVGYDRLKFHPQEDTK
jgi:hypothetical protein